MSQAVCWTNCVHMFKPRWNNYKGDFRKFDGGEDCMQRHLYKHFQLLGHTVFFARYFITLINKADLRIPTRHEDYWIHTLKTKEYLWDLVLKVVTGSYLM